MRFPDQSLIGDLNDNTTPRITTGVFPSIPTSTTDENDTVYDLLPVIINRPPVITKPITEASTPQIKPYSTANATGDFMYLFPDGTVKVNIGSTFKIAIEAEQPNILNVENGILKLIPPSSSLTFIWRKDSEILNSSTSDSLQSSVVVSGSVIEFNSVQPSSAGTYLCEISNDIGTTISETITLEILNLDFDTLFYRNLVKNPTGADGVNEWNANNSDFISKPFSKIPSQDFIRPNRVDLFGYTMDMMHPRPYQIDMGAIQNFDMTQTYLNNPYYFTRTRYKFDRKGGTFQVRAYQDIDLTDIIPLIKGGIYGVEGVRALFSCYIGNGLSQYIPVEELVDPRRRLDPLSYYQSYARLSLVNFLTAGPADKVVEKAYVTIEEFDNETRVPTTLLVSNQGATQTYNSRITLSDPWQKRIYDPAFQVSVYPIDIYGLQETSPNDPRDLILNVANNLYPDQRYRYTYGQYVEFNKQIIERLNPKTTKVRISLNFDSTDWRIFETYTDLVNDADEIFEVLSWETPYKKNKFSKPPLSPTYKPIYQRIKEYSGSLDKTPSEFFPTAQDPRVMVTGLNLALLPILTQQNQVTDYYTGISLVRNLTPTSSFPSGLTGTRIYDPLGTLSKALTVTFKYYSEGVPTLDNLGYLQTRDRIELRLKLSSQPGSPNTQNASSFVDYQITNGALFPFVQNSVISYEGAIENAITPNDIQSFTPFFDYVRYRLLDPYQSDRNSRTPNFSTTANTLADNGYVVWGMSGSISPSQYPEIERPWINKARYIITFGIVNASNPSTPPGTQTRLTTSQIGGSQNDTQAIQSYYLDFDFTNPADTKVTLARPASFISQSINVGNLFSTSVVAGSSGSKYIGKGTTTNPIELEHSIDPYGVLQSTIPAEFKFTSMNNGGFGLGGYQYQFEVRERSLIKLITALHVNLGNYTRVSLRANRYYQSRVEQALSFYDSEIQFAQNNPTLNVYTLNGVTVNDLQDFRQQLVDYAYDIQEVPNQTQYATILRIFENNQAGISRFSINIFNPAFYPSQADLSNPQTQLRVIDQYIRDTVGGSLGTPQYQTLNSRIFNDAQVTDYTNTTLGLQIAGGTVFPSNLNLFREVPPHLLNMRTSIQKIELLSIRPSDINFGPGSPAAGSTADGTNYKIYYTPLQDTNEGNYIPSSQD